MRRFWLSIIVVGLICLVGLAQPGWSGPYESGVSAYKRGNYTQAKRYFKKYLQSSSHPESSTSKALFYLGLSYAQNKQFNAAHDIFTALLKNQPPNSALAAKARANLAVITQAQLHARGKTKTAKALRSMTAKTTSQSRHETNYLANAITKGKVVHWNPARMPLKVFITSGASVPNWNSSMISLVHNAMNEWQSATKRNVRFVTTSRRSDADIVVNWTRALSHNKVGENPFEAMGNTITRSDITIATHAPNGRVMPWQGLKQTILHEMGHAIGIQGHSPFPHDIMYWQVNAQQGQSLTSRDIQTINMVYALDADIQNSSGASVAQSRKALETARLGIQQQSSNNPQAAIEKYKTALRLDPTQVPIYHLLAHSYRQLKQLTLSEATYRQGLQTLPHDKSLKASLAASMIDLGVQRYNQHRAQTARSYFQNAVNVLEPLVNSNNPPQGTQENLAIARKNLAGL